MNTARGSFIEIKKIRKSNGKSGKVTDDAARPAPDRSYGGATGGVGNDANRGSSGGDGSGEVE